MGQRYATIFRRLADALETDVEVIAALVDGEVFGQIMIDWPTGCKSTLCSVDTLNELRACRRAVERFGVEAVRDEETRSVRRLRDVSAVAPRRPMTFHLYRLWGSGDRLLYIGVTRNLDGRMKAHRRRWGDVIENVTSEEFSSHVDVLAAETDAIRTEQPPFNFEHVG